MIDCPKICNPTTIKNVVNMNRIALIRVKVHGLISQIGRFGGAD